MNPYLTDPHGNRIDSRGAAFARTGLGAFGVLGLAIIAAILSPPGTGGAIMAVGGLIFVAGIAYGWMKIFECGKLLHTAVNAWFGGQPGAAVEPAKRALRIAFRADFRAKAYHVLGLAAEAAGDFAAAAELFGLAEAAIPAMAAPMRKSRALSLIRGHLAIALCSLGRVQEAAMQRDRAMQAFHESMAGGGLNALMDDATWGLGSISVNSVIESIEAGRDHRALISLVQLCVARAAGVHQDAAAIMQRDRPLLTHALLPREIALAALIERDALAVIAPPQAQSYVMPPVPAEASDWAQRVLATQ